MNWERTSGNAPTPLSFKIAPVGGTFAHEQRKLAERRAVRLDLHTVGLHRRAECQRRDGGARVRDEDFVIAWAPELGSVSTRILG